jgi:hypothetical protein
MQKRVLSCERRLMKITLLSLFCSDSWIENGIEGMTFWNGAWHPKGITSSTQQN